ncbi:MAG TPA: Nudix family hydrolase [Rhodanobacteraceae bacterium]|nr:Nudix family hydrolase [Rhodanobacteraceae bacterium]
MRLGQEVQALPRSTDLIRDKSVQDEPVHVVAGVIRDATGRVLVAERPAGKHLAGYWEFPGGKSDPGESPLDALRRELAEELGIRVEAAEPLISVPWTYPEKRIVLDAWLVTAYSGDAHAREHGALRWFDPADLPKLPMPPADMPIVMALRLPDRYLITPPLAPNERDVLLDGIERACRNGIRLIQLRQPAWSPREVESTAVEAHAICRRHRAALLVNGDFDIAARCDGVHVPARVARTLDARPAATTSWFAVSCHDEAELAHAARIGADFVTLAPVAATPSHPEATPLGWPRFAELATASPLPVYALGGLAVADITTARRSGGQGIAAIRALWP